MSSKIFKFKLILFEKFIECLFLQKNEIHKLPHLKIFRLRLKIRINGGSAIHANSSARAVARKGAGKL